MIRDRTTKARKGLCADFIEYRLFAKGGLLTLRYYFYFLIASNLSAGAVPRDPDNLPYPLPDGPGLLTLNNMAEAIVELKNVNIYQGGNLILEKVNIIVNKAEFVYLVGKTGTGKSSLLKTLYGDLALKEGEGTVAGFNLKEMTWKKVPYLRRNLGVVFQDFQLLTDRNVNDNLKFVLRATGWKDEKLMNEKIGDVLDKVGLKSKGFKMAYEMSGGEQQRVDIARALLNSPKLILADEPTGNLDPETSDEIMQLLFQISKEYGTTVIMATHDYRVVHKFPARTVRTEKGRVYDNATIPAM
jgi:cell division transport system ATP-binding protein